MPTALPPLPDYLGLPTASVIAVPAGGQVLHRIVDSPMQPAHFLPRLLKVRKPFRDAPLILDAGLSMLETIDQAKDRMRRPGAIARVTLPPGAGIYIAKTLGPGHFTVWGHPELLAQHATLV